MARYKIKDPRFAIHLQKIETVDLPNGQKQKRLNEQSYFAGSPIELSDADALAHIHKIDPIDADAKKLFKDFHDKQDAAIAARQPAANIAEFTAAQIAQLRVALGLSDAAKAGTLSLNK